MQNLDETHSAGMTDIRTRYKTVLIVGERFYVERESYR